MRLGSVVSACFTLLVAAHGSAQLDEERLRLMRETVSYTDVVDAFDGGDRFDLGVSLAYERLRERGTITREHVGPAGTTDRIPVAESRRDVSQLKLGLEVGLHRDLMAFVSLPLVLSERRSLEVVEGGTPGLVRATPADEQPLLTLPFGAPTRAGLDYVAFGGAWAVLNQMRRAWQPTWVVRIEGRRALGAPLRPSCGAIGGEACDAGTGRKAGSSRGMSGVRLETRFGRRYRYAEAIAGLSYQLEWPATARGRFAPVSLPGLRPARPGPEASAMLGVAVIPWEDRDSFQRFALDVRLLATHVAKGTEYSALFDALGTSRHPALSGLRYQGVRGSVPSDGVLMPCGDRADVDCGEGAAAAFQGVTQVASHLRYGGQLGIEIQAARYVRFSAGTSLLWVTPHAITGQGACGTRGGGGGVSEERRACASGPVDPRHRGAIDAPGRRFFMQDQLLIGIYAQATALF